MTNLRFGRLNLVDLAGSERLAGLVVDTFFACIFLFIIRCVAFVSRQKSSGAEGERLKEAASINKSLSTLGHVTSFC